MPLQTRSAMAKLPPLLKRARTRSASHQQKQQVDASNQPQTPSIPARQDIAEYDETVEPEHDEDSTNERSRVEKRTRSDTNDDLGPVAVTRTKGSVVKKVVLGSPIALASQRGVSDLQDESTSPAAVPTYTYTYHAYLAVPLHPALSPSTNDPAPHPGLKDNDSQTFNSYDTYDDLPPHLRTNIDVAGDLAKEEAKIAVNRLEGLKVAKRRVVSFVVEGDGMGMGEGGYRGIEMMGQDEDVENEQEAVSSGIAEDESRKWRTINMPETVEYGPLPATLKSYTYLPPPLLLSPHPSHQNLTSEFLYLDQHRARGLAELKEFGHASRRAWNGIGRGTELVGESGSRQPGQKIGKKRKRRNSFELELYHDPPTTDPTSSSPETISPPTLESYSSDWPGDEPIDMVVVAEVEELPDFVFWDETLGLEEDEDVDEHQGQDQDQDLEQERMLGRHTTQHRGPLNIDHGSTTPQSANDPMEKEADVASDPESAPFRLDLRRPPVIFPVRQSKTPAGIVSNAYDRTMRTTFTTQSDDTESISSLMDAADDVDEAGGGTFLNDVSLVNIHAEGSVPQNKIVKGALRPMPLHLSGIDLAAFPPHMSDLRADGPHAADTDKRTTTRGRGRGRGGGVARGKRGGGSVAGASDPLARVRRSEGVIGLPGGLRSDETSEAGNTSHTLEAKRGGKAKQRMPMKAALSPFRLDGAARDTGDGDENTDPSEDVLVIDMDVTEGDHDRPNGLDEEPDMVVGSAAPRPRVASPEAMTGIEQTESPVEGPVTDKQESDKWEQIQDLLPEPHRVPVDPSFTPDRYADTASFSPSPLPPDVHHPFHPSFGRLCKIKPYMRVKWIIPIEGEVIMPGLSDDIGNQVDVVAARRKGDKNMEVPSFVPSPASFSFPEDVALHYAAESASESPKSKARPKMLKWRPRFLLEFWYLLLKLRKLGRFGQISFALSGPDPDPHLKQELPSDGLAEHLYIPKRTEPKVVPPSEHPRRPLLGIHIKLFCDLTWALKIRFVMSSIRFGTNDAYLKGSGTGFESLTDGGEVLPRTLFALRKLCLLGERGEVLTVA